MDRGGGGGRGGRDGGGGGGRGGSSYGGRDGGGGGRGGLPYGGRDGGNGGGRGGTYQNQPQQYGGRGGNYHNQQQYGDHGGRGGGNYQSQQQQQYGDVGGRGGGSGRGRGGNYSNFNQTQHQGGGGGGDFGGGRGRSGGYNPNPRPGAEQGGGGGGYRAAALSQRQEAGGGAWNRPAGASGDRGIVTTTGGQSELSLPDFGSLQVSEQLPPTSLQYSMEGKNIPIKRPDNGGTFAIRSIRILVNHFPVSFDSNSTIIHYDVEIKQDISSGNRFAKKSIPKSDLRLIQEKLFSDDKFPLQMTAYDGEKNIFSAVPLPTGTFEVRLSPMGDKEGPTYKFTIKFVNEVKLSKLKNYLSGNLLSIPRDVLQGMDLVMKENASRQKISIGRNFYSREFNRGDDLRCGVAAMRGFQPSLKPTSQGLAMCLDYSVLAFRKRLPVIEFLMENVRGFQRVEDVKKLRKQVETALKGLKVSVTHRRTKQKYTVKGLTSKDTRELSFPSVDLEGNASGDVTVVSYFEEKYGVEIKHKGIPCLDLGKPGKINYVPMEFCVLAEERRYPKELLDRDAAVLLKNISLAPPKVRRDTICQMVEEEYGPSSGMVPRNFGFEVDQNMTIVQGRVIKPPSLKLGTLSGGAKVAQVDRDKCHWNLVGKSVFEGKAIERWAMIDFSSADRFRLNLDYFIPKLMERCRNLGIRMEEPLVVRCSNMRQLNSVEGLRHLLESVVEEAGKISKGRLQIIVCPMSGRDDGYKALKWVSETKVGVLTQCCLSGSANKGNDQYLANLALKINAKLGGSNYELVERPKIIGGQEHVMFIGADVNHPSPSNVTSPSIAAVVATINFPAVNRYAARVSPQDHRKEKIVNFGNLCLELVRTYARLNKVRPSKIVVFRDGVSEGQFDMVLNEELLDLKRVFAQENYWPTITLVVARKRHLTRLFPENERDAVGNVPPGTVVDTKIVHPFEFDFYLCSHFGGIGTSKPTHYSVLWDEHGFTSDELQKLIYDLCFTFARCTKPVSLVPPVYYADLVAYRGRMFQEVVMETRSESSSSTSSFNEGFYKLHPELEDFMFFV